MNGIHRPAFLVLLLVLLAAGSSPAVMWENLRFEQIHYVYEDPENNVEFSATGRCAVEYGKDSAAGFLNVAAMIPGLSTEPAWIVRNLPLMDITLGPPDEIIGYQFPLAELGVDDGMPVSFIDYGTLITPEPMLDSEAPLFLATTPLDRSAEVDATVRTMNEGKQGLAAEAKQGAPANMEYVPYSGFPSHSVTTWMGCNMPNVPLDSTTDPMDDSACAPASCANSMAWLDQQHPEIDVPDNQRALLKQLSNLMNRARNCGASNETMARAKLDFIEAHNLPIHVKLQSAGSSGDIKSSSGHTTATDAGGDSSGWPTESWLKSEAQNGEDVELLVTYMYKDASGWHATGGHAVVLSGLGGMMDDWTWVAWKHDAKQGDATGTEQDHGILHNTGDGIIIIGMGYSFTPKGASAPVKVEAYLDGVLSESYDASAAQPPSAEDFDDYCDYITRTIKPGGSLTIDFPTEDRCMDVSVYQVDRNQEPPTQRGLWRWTNNSGKSRTLTNPTDICITVKIHNDDEDGDWWLWYDDYTVSLTQNKSMVSPDPSNFEEAGGFSLGGDDEYCEFGPAVAPSMVVDYTPEVILDDVPSGLGAPGGTFELFLDCQIPAWNKYWTQLGLIVDVLEVAAPGDLLVEVPATGFVHVFNVSAPGEYRIELGAFPEAPDFSLRLAAQGGLEFTFDAIGVPTLVDYLSPVEQEGPPPAAFLAANRPNPFNPITEIQFGLERPGFAELAVFDAAGRKVAILHRGVLPAGPHVRTWDGTDAGGRPVAAGTYLYRLESADGVMSRKMTIVK